MTATTVDFQVARRAGAPRGAAVLGDAAARLLKAAGAWLRSLRAGDPYADREALLQLARSYERSQPGFAADLRAAALRYEPEDVR
ncbi:hypothetical protein [Caldimonas aquatica]|uniref:Uncharacterized protein n=1 Tax=Caldimonas aquatica TaxID=376175 RepID=A0ABY6MSF6_9BURK|nr:hypothetical protein [Schlegelella aquatica]UZD54918.1 hypothetical protein OMP39_14835 [Schlegelella aquatica]